MSTRSLARTVAEWEAIYSQLLEMRDRGAAETIGDGLRKAKARGAGWGGKGGWVIRSAGSPSQRRRSAD